ncbi:hypothetical protein [Amycolatopsis jiangsuensis]|uniref:Uncharacterized protein n=1 Tax=Amycolatopsis jiangsuensis TaxID=1181879 RepID=A0A840IQP6_9PSEU|nr:hypothetical protein [Amycolatopsis jiangsuensis]MBB4683775.1 hypothetical protein [Amycolatopsis jiangsuensis]
MATIPPGQGRPTGPELAVPPPLPFDPELATALAELVDAGPVVPSLTPDMIPPIRSTAVRSVRLTPGRLGRDGRFEVAELPVPGRGVAPEVRVLICRPAGAA